MDTLAFRTSYARLNQKQREAVNAIQGPVMVIAGPGTGKTSILTLRIANILRKTDTAPDSILALTFTESGAYSMRKKLVETIGSQAYRVSIFTFHGFANYIIGRFKESFPRIVGGKPATPPDQAMILEHIFLRNRFKLIRPFGDIFYYLPKALRAISELKRENISPTRFSKMLKERQKFLSSDRGNRHLTGRFKGEQKAKTTEALRNVEKSLELAKVYEEYESALSKERLFDFEDMILEVISALRADTALLRTLQEEFQYILADEHQDANNAQNTLLELLASFDESPNLFIVGDEKQAIYRFQGASLENFLYFKKRYPNALLINLIQNYRSTQSILDAAHSLIEKRAFAPDFKDKVFREKLKARTQGELRDVSFVECADEAEEVRFVCTSIATKIKNGVEPHTIAILLRNNEDSLPFVEAFQKTEIPFSVLSDEDILRDEELSKLLLILRATDSPGDPTSFSLMLHLEFLKVDPISLYEILRFCREKRVTIFQVLQTDKLRKAAKLRSTHRILKIFSDFCRWALYAKNEGAGEAVEKISRESGFLGYVLKKRGSLRVLQKLDALFSSLKEFSAHKRSVSLSDFLQMLDRLDRHGMRILGRSARLDLLESVSIMTAHRAKGLEFDFVYIPKATNGHWGGRKGRSDFYLPFERLSGKGDEVENDRNEDERRLFFVALTRARKEVIITAQREKENGKQLLPSQFVADIDSEYIVKTFLDTEKMKQPKVPDLLKPKINPGPSITLKSYLSKTFLDQGLTVTALNNYLSCPWKYFFKNLIRLPELPKGYQSYGTAIHDALSRFFDPLRDGNIAPHAKKLTRFFEEELAKTPLPAKEYQEFLKRGRAALSGYFLRYRGAFTLRTQNEFSVTGIFLPFGKGVKVLLRGTLDKIEQNEDGTVTVVDYKTGLPKSRAEILGETKSSSGNMKRQLDFYKLLLDNYAGGKYRMRIGVIDFVEPDKKGKYHRESFEIDERDVFALTKEIERVAQEIYSLSFWGKRCGDRKCEFCRLRQTLS